jgi:UDP-glucuronate 4-epimerase
VRYSIDHPRKYVESNIMGFYNILENVEKYKVKRLFYASSSSVYGENKNFPLNEKENISPKNIYGLSKKINEEISLIYNNYYKVKLVGLRFFTIYGEWGRPDMFLFKLFNSFLLKKIFYLNNSGNHMRDFTYIKDVVEITKKLLFSKKTKSNHSIFNVCSNKPIKITKIIKFFKKEYGDVKIKKILRNKLDVKNTHGSNRIVKQVTSFSKFTDYKSGIKNSFEWYKKYKIHKII